MDGKKNCKTCRGKCEYIYHQHYDFIKEKVNYEEFVEAI